MDRTNMIQQAINMLKAQDLSGWSDAHDDVAIDALTDALALLDAQPVG